MTYICLLITTVVLFGVVFTHNHTKPPSIPGGEYDIDPKDPELLQMLHNVEDQFPARLNTTGISYRLGNVISAKGQVIAGVKTSIKFELYQQPTSCKQMPTTTTTEKAVFPQILVLNLCKETLKICFASFFLPPTTEPLKLTGVSCKI